MVSALTGSEVYHNELGILFSDIKVLLRNFSNVAISHVNRKYKVVAHNLAKQALQLEEEKVWTNDFSYQDDSNI